MSSSGVATLGTTIGRYQDKIDEIGRLLLEKEISVNQSYKLALKNGLKELSPNDQSFKFWINYVKEKGFVEDKPYDFVLDETKNNKAENKKYNKNAIIKLILVATIGFIAINIFTKKMTKN